MKKLIYLLLVLGILQLAVALLTYGFSLYDDEAIWHYMGRSWLRMGIAPYRESFDNKTPLIWLIYGISDLLFGVNYWFPRVLGTIVEMIGVWYVYKIALHLAGRRTGIIAMTMYGLALLWRCTEGRFPSLTETFEVTFINIAVFLALAAKGKRSYVASGLAAGVAIAFRLTGLVPAAAIFLFSIRKRGALTFAASAAACIAALVAMTLLAGIHLRDLWQFAFLINFQRGQPFDYHLYLTRLTRAFFHCELVCFYPLALLYFLMTRKADILLAWLIGGCLYILMLGTFSEAYFKDILPPLAIAAAAAVDVLVTKANISFGKALAVIWICFLPKDTEPFFSAMEITDPGATTGRSQDYCSPPYPPLTNYARKQVGLWIKTNTRSNEIVYVPTPTVLVYTERRCPALYFSAGAEWAAARRSFYHQMTINQPDLIALPLNTGNEANVTAEQRDYMHNLARSAAYRTDTCINGYAIYRKVRSITESSMLSR
jgi:hypothetical protein